MSYYCHQCQAQIASDAMLPEFTCPTCHSGFIEELPSRGESSRDSSLRNSDSVVRLADVYRASRQSSDDNTDDEDAFLEAIGAPIARIFNLIEPRLHETPPNQIQAPQSDSSQPQSNTPAQQVDQANPDNRSQTPVIGPMRRRSSISRSASFDTRNTNLHDVLNDFITGVSFGTNFPESSSNQSGTQVPSGRGVINVDFPMPLFLHSSPGDYAWGNAGFDAVITQLLNNLDGSGSGPPPMPRDQIDKLPKLKIREEQVKTNLQCSVCTDDFVVNDSVRQLPCDHIFHENCIIPWLEIQSSCPICRKTFTNGLPSQGQTNPSQVNIANAAPTIPQLNLGTNSSTTPQTPTNASNTTNQRSSPDYDLTEDDCD